ncbi:MAG: PhoH family protein [Flavobacteriaceae bacterium]
MKEIEIELIDIDPRDFFGNNNENIDKIKLYFPKLKIVARGNKIKAFGQKEVLKEFKEGLNKLLKYFTKHNSINEYFIENLFNGNNENLTSKISNNNLILHGVNGRLVKAVTLNQIKIVELISKKDLVFAIGPAGTGKTYTSVALAVKFLKEKKVKRIILTRPAVEAGENLGFLPGDMNDKLDPYMQPLYDALREMIPKEKLKKFIESGTIQIAPLAYMRGRNLDDAFVILDEAQNTTHSQMKMFLTRMGKNAKFIITGDPGQIDLPMKIVSGLKEAILILKEINEIGILYLNEKDVMRHKLLKKVINAYKTIEIQN